MDQAELRIYGPETTALVDAVQTWRYSVDVRQYGFFLAKKKRPASVGESGQDDNKTADGDRRPTTPTTPGGDLGYEWVVSSLASFESGFFKGTLERDRFVCFADPSTYDTYPGWMLRNLLVLVSQKWKLGRVQILCYRDIPARRHEAHSMILRLEQALSDATATVELPGSSTIAGMPKVTGWERNSAGKVVSRVANLGEYMDPQRSVAFSSSDLEN